MIYGDNGVLVDFEQMGQVISVAEVLTVEFPHFPERLLVDARSNDKEGPLIQVIDPVRSTNDRLSWLYRRRPSLGRPQSISFLFWPHSISLLMQSPVRKSIQRRVGADIETEIRAQCDLALKQLLNLELSASQALLRGEQCVNLWPPQEVKEGRV